VTTTVDRTAAPERSSPVQSNAAGPPNAGSNVQTRARAREVTARTWTLGLGQVRRFTGPGWLDATPATVGQVLAYTRAGGWIPGDRARWLEAFGKVYGFVVAVPVTVAAFVTLWFIQRPTRVVGGVLLWYAVRWAL
jgi:hypothetical protein